MYILITFMLYLSKMCRWVGVTWRKYIVHCRDQKVNVESEFTIIMTEQK